MKYLITWFANNHVAANLATLLIIVSGLLVLPLLRKEIIPEISFDIVEIVVALPGAGPTQVERSVSRVVEQSLVGIDGILDVSTVASKNLSVTMLEISDTVSLNEVINKVRARMDAVPLPAEATRPIVREILVLEPVMALAVSGETDMEGLNAIAESMATEIRALPGVSLAYVTSMPRREFLVELSEMDMQRYRVAFSEITNALRVVASDITGATLNTNAGEVSVVGQPTINNSATLESLAIRSMPDGSRITLSDVANIKDNYIVDNSRRKFDGKNVVYIGINRAESEDLIMLANNVNHYVEVQQATLPKGVSLEVSNDVSKEVSGRINMLTNNAIGGFILVFFNVLLFMNLRSAFWISNGIPISFLGTFVILYFMGASINMISLFAFILVLGIVVDDAIVVSESILSQHEKGNYGTKGSVDGVLEVYEPVLFSALTTIVAFCPLLFMPGEEGRLIFIVPVVVITVLLVSLTEALLMFPSHLTSHKPEKKEIFPLVNRLQASLNNFLDRFISNQYSPALEKYLLWRYSVLAFFCVMFFISIALLAFRWVDVAVSSDIQSDTVTAHLEMITDTSVEETETALRRLEKAAFDVRFEVNKELGFEQITHIASELNAGSPTKGTVSIFFNPNIQREINGSDLEKKILEKFGVVENLRNLAIASTISIAGTPLDIELAHANIETLKTASRDLQQILKSYDGVRGSWDSLSQGGREVGFSLKPEAKDMGITSVQVAMQIRQAFHGDYVPIFDDQGVSVPVNIQYPAEQRNSLWFLENLQIALPDGSYVPLYSVADLNFREGPTSINLHNGQRTVRIFASFDKKASEATIMAALQKDFLNHIGDTYPGMTWKRAGGQQRGFEIINYLLLAFPVSLLVMYILMATLFASYSQPLMVMTAIPFGIVGALIGHVIMGAGVTLWSLIGIIAVSGVVVNDNLVLVDRINRLREEGISLLVAIRDAGVTRFRPIILTSTTTFLGLFPLMFESTPQAQFLIPMAISLGFGVIFATTISLILIPVLYAILYDFQVLVEEQSIPSRINAFLREKFKSDQI